MSNPEGVGFCSTGVLAGDLASVQLLPSGRFQATDGRNLTWFIDYPSAQRMIQRFGARKNPAPIDYEHQTLNAAKNGMPAPAAGWFAGLDWVDEVGLFATSLTWTEAAKRQIRAGEYRYISPVFRYDPTTGEVLDILHAGLTNVPALDGMARVEYAAAARYRFNASAEEREVCRLLGLSPGELGRTRDNAAIASAKSSLTDQAAADVQVCRLLGLAPEALERTRARRSAR